jgi:hypothetical protein
MDQAWVLGHFYLVNVSFVLALIDVAKLPKAVRTANAFVVARVALLACNV